jgi:hypothetical protein
MNNPLKYSDPTGNFFVIDDWIHGFVKGLFRGGFRGAWETANRDATNSFRIFKGLFQSDETKSDWGRIWEVVSRFTWQGIQTVAGYTGAEAASMFGNVESVDYYRGATVVRGTHEGLAWGAGDPAVTLGSYIIGDRNISADPNNFLFQHEYGHYLQSQRFGFAYLTKIGFASARSEGNHNLHPTEQDANKRALYYFSTNDASFTTWSFADNPIVGYRGGKHSIAPIIRLF